MLVASMVEPLTKAASPSLLHNLYLFWNGGQGKGACCN